MLIKLLALVATVLGILGGVLMLASTVRNELLAGQASAVDGDTLVIAGQTIDLFGVASPPFGELCDHAGEKWRCGATARLELARWIGDATLICRRHPSLSGAAASCNKGLSDVGRWLVRNGWAVADSCSSLYAREEQRARLDRAGIWASRFEAPGGC